MILRVYSFDGVMLPVQGSRQILVQLMESLLYATLKLYRSVPILKINTFLSCRRHFGLRTYTNYNDMIGVTHSLATINKLRAVYPTPADIELFPGGEYRLHYHMQLSLKS